MSDLYEKIVSSRGSFERLIARLPGFKGYQDKQARRTADRMLREYIAGEMDKRIDRLVRLEKLILDMQGGMMYMPRTRSAKSRIQLYRDKIFIQAPGYDGMWAQMKIGSEELEKIYAFDEAHIGYADKFDVALDVLEQAIINRENLEQVIWDLENIATEALDAYDLRDEVLTNLSKTV
ncbi:MAG: hypothetical protein SH821_12515 [Phototrophicales bacterium]|nr:hypothetical protein [Phototrophicales bacterium]